MLYVLDEPSIGLHPKDNVKMIDTLRSLRDLGNTVIVVEHDEDTIRAADHVLELGPGPGIHGGQVVIAGTLDEILGCPDSPTGQYLSGQRRIETPAERREINGQSLHIRGARENNLKAVDVEIPLGQFICVSGASGSGKSTLINEILYKELWKRLVDSRSLSGAHDALEGVDHLTRVINIDQSPIGRNSRSNPSTYVGFYDQIRNLFANTPIAERARLQAGAVQLQRQGRPVRRMPGRGRDRDEALLHAGRGGGLRRLQGPALQRRDAGSHPQRQDHRRRARHVDRGRRRLLRGSAGDRPQGQGAGRPWPGLPDPRAVGHDALRRRGTADQAGDGAVQSSSAAATSSTSWTSPRRGCTWPTSRSSSTACTG